MPQFIAALLLALSAWTVLMLWTVRAALILLA
jgi:hypothetical protein